MFDVVVVRELFVAFGGEELRVGAPVDEVFADHARFRVA